MIGIYKQQMFAQKYVKTWAMVLSGQVTLIAILRRCLMRPELFIEEHLNVSVIARIRRLRQPFQLRAILANGRGRLHANVHALVTVLVNVLKEEYGGRKNFLVI